MTSSKSHRDKGQCRDQDWDQNAPGPNADGWRSDTRSYENVVEHHRRYIRDAMQTESQLLIARHHRNDPRRLCQLRGPRRLRRRHASGNGQEEDRGWESWIGRRFGADRKSANAQSRRRRCGRLRTAG